MKKLLAIIAILIVIFTPEPALSQIHFRKFDASTSLPDNHVRNMVMLPDGMIWIETPSMLSSFDGVSTATHRYNLNSVPLIEYSGINCLYHDSRNRIWLKNRDNIWVYNIETTRFTYDASTIISEFGINCDIDNIVILERDKYLIYEKQQHLIHFYNDTNKELIEIAMPNIMGNLLTAKVINGNIWIFCDNGMLAQWNEATKSIQYIEQHLFPDNTIIKNLSRFKVTTDDQGVLWIITDKDLICYNTNKYSHDQKIEIPLDENDIFTSIAFDNRDHIWIGSSRSGLRLIDNTNFEVEHLPYMEVVDGNNVDQSNDISQIYVDPKGGVWVATMTEGLLYYHKDIFKLRNINNTTISSGKIGNQNIKCLLNEPDGTILFGTTKGLYRYDPRSNSVTTPYPELESELCIGLYLDRDNRVWLGTFHNGAFCIDNGNIRHYVHPEMPDISISYLNSTPNLNCVRTFEQTPDGKIYVSVYGDIGIINETTGEIDLLDVLKRSKNFLIRKVSQISNDKLLFQGDSGTVIYDYRKGVLDETSFFPRKHGSCHDFIIDSRGLYWMATLEGAIIYDPTNEKIQVIGRREGLASNKVLSILEDNFNNIWITTSAGISTIKMSRDWSIDDVLITNLSQYDGIPNTSFYHRSSILGPDGNLYFGSSNGLCVIEPSAFANSSKSVKPVLLNLKLNNRNVPINDELSHISLKHDESSITFEFSGVNYSNPNHTKYRYKLENFNDDWVEVRNANSVASATFSLLHPGQYRFKIQCASNGSWWSNEITEISITILPPWWQSNIAIIAYIILLLITMALIISYITNRNIQKALQKQRIEEDKRNAELEEMKLRFFVNVSHELRTPLSLIIIPLESLLEKISDHYIKSQLETMHRNAKSLLQLVNHLLDFRKIDMDQERLKPTVGDLHTFSEAIVESFKSSAEVNMINLAFESNNHNLTIMFDHSMMQKILNNLLSNALKFTPKGGDVTLSVNQIENSNGGQSIEISVTDTGKGIPQKDLDFIFDRFFQASNNNDAKGTGIGLNLSKNYTELHGGEISVESVLGQGSTFKVLIPMNIESEVIAVEESAEEPIMEVVPDSDDRYKLLIIEDNKDFRDYMVNELHSIYDISVAENGKQGLEAIKESMPDLITSDVMMPEMDGMELCRILKDNIETSHIPIILLTAHSSDESRLSSYESGADAFISKPFHWGVLHARIRNLIEERKKRVQDFSNNSDNDLETLNLAPLDMKFIKRAIESIDRNLDNTDYSVETMSDDLAMNRMSIYRKFKSIMEQTPADFIRTIRLKRAAKWIESGKGRGYSLIEISEMFGFNTPKYFSKYFKEIYGETPMQYVSRFK